MISFFNEGLSFSKYEKDKLDMWINESVSAESFMCGDLNFIFCTDDYLLDINKQYLDHDYFTDIITFDYSEGNVIAGDIFISIDRVEDNAKQFDVSFDYELLRIVIHGVLHLLGYKDKEPDDKALMTKKENFYLDRY